MKTIVATNSKSLITLEADLVAALLLVIVR